MTIDVRRKTAAILVVMGSCDFFFCSSHICMAGHMQHPPYALWHYVVDAVWVVFFVVASVIAYKSNLWYRRVFSVLLIKPLPVFNTKMSFA